MTGKELSERCTVGGFEDGGREPRGQECGWPQGAGKGKDMDSPLDPPERSTILTTPLEHTPQISPIEKRQKTYLSHVYIIYIYICTIY